jgi:6-phosphogluconate dehydrogenase
MVKAGATLIARSIPLSRIWIKATSSSMVATPSSQDTIRRNRELSAEGFNFIGTGVSGGEEGH